MGVGENGQGVHRVRLVSEVEPSASSRLSDHISVLVRTTDDRCVVLIKSVNFGFRWTALTSVSTFCDTARDRRLLCTS